MTSSIGAACAVWFRPTLVVPHAERVPDSKPSAKTVAVARATSVGTTNSTMPVITRQITARVQKRTQRGCDMLDQYSPARGRRAGPAWLLPKLYYQPLVLDRTESPTSSMTMLVAITGSWSRDSGP